jgi:hypothetical protein
MDYLATVVGLLGGLVLGWLARRRVARWCAACGYPLGPICVSCQARHHAAGRVR